MMMSTPRLSAETSRERAMSLVEILISLALSLIIMGVVVYGFQTAVRAYQKVSLDYELTNQARSTVTYFERMIGSSRFNYFGMGFADEFYTKLPNCANHIPGFQPSWPNIYRRDDTTHLYYEMEGAGGPSIWLSYTDNDITFTDGSKWNVSFREDGSASLPYYDDTMYAWVYDEGQVILDDQPFSSRVSNTEITLLQQIGINMQGGVNEAFHMEGDMNSPGFSERTIPFAFVDISIKLRPAEERYAAEADETKSFWAKYCVLRPAAYGWRSKNIR